MIYLRIHEDVIDVQLDRADILSGGHSRGRDDRGLARHVPLVICDGSASSGTSGIGKHLGGELQPQVSGSRVNNVALSLQIDRNEALSVGNSYGRNRESTIPVNFTTIT